MSRARVLIRQKPTCPLRTSRNPLYSDDSGTFEDGASRARTGDLFRAREALSQLSYGPRGGSIVGVATATSGKAPVRDWHRWQDARARASATRLWRAHGDESQVTR